MKRIACKWCNNSGRAKGNPCPRCNPESLELSEASLERALSDIQAELDSQGKRIAIQPTTALVGGNGTEDAFQTAKRRGIKRRRVR